MMSKTIFKNTLLIFKYKNQINSWVFAYMLKVIPNKLVVRSQLDIYVFIEFDTFPPLLCVHISYTPV